MKWAQLTPKQRKHLVTACAQGINPKRDIYDEEAVETLETAGLIHQTTNRKGRTLWRPTDTGRGLVASRGLIPTFLHRRSQYGYTHSPTHKLPGEPEVMEAA